MATPAPLPQRETTRRSRRLRGQRPLSPSPPAEVVGSTATPPSGGSPLSGAPPPPNDIAHLDVRICFTHPPTKQVKLIDLVRCLPSYSPVHINFEYKQPDMYTPADVTWKHFQLDWKCLGLIICFVEDDTVNSKDYHTMLSGGHTIPSHPFVKSLVEKEEW